MRQCAPGMPDRSSGWTWRRWIGGAAGGGLAMAGAGRAARARRITVLGRAAGGAGDGVPLYGGGAVRGTAGLASPRDQPWRWARCGYTPGEAPPTVEEYAEAVTGALRRVWRGTGWTRRGWWSSRGEPVAPRGRRALHGRPAQSARRTGRRCWRWTAAWATIPRPALYGARYHAALAERMTAPAAERARIVGRYCESGDVLVEEVRCRWRARARRWRFR